MAAGDEFDPGFVELHLLPSIHEAVEAGDWILAHNLVLTGADINQVVNGLTPLDIAIRDDDQVMVEKLIEMGAKESQA